MKRKDILEASSDEYRPRRQGSSSQDFKLKQKLILVIAKKTGWDQSDLEHLSLEELKDQYKELQSGGNENIREVTPVGQPEMGKIKSSDDKNVTVTTPSGDKMIPKDKLTPGTKPGELNAQIADTDKLKPGTTVNVSTVAAEEINKIRHLAGLKEITPDQAPAAPEAETEQPPIDTKENFLKKLQASGTDAASVADLISTDPDGTVDVEETMLTMAREMIDTLPQILTAFEGLIDNIVKAKANPAIWSQYSPEDQQGMDQAVAEFNKNLPIAKAEMKKAQQEYQKQLPAAQQTIATNQNTRFKQQTGMDMVRTAAGAKTNIGTGPYESLDHMLRIAGLR